MRKSSAPSLSSMSLRDAERRLGLDSRAALLDAELADLRRLDSLEAFEPHALPKCGPSFAYAARHLGRPSSVVVAGGCV